MDELKGWRCGWQIMGDRALGMMKDASWGKGGGKTGQDGDATAKERARMKWLSGQDEGVGRECAWAIRIERFTRTKMCTKISAR